MPRPAVRTAELPRDEVHRILRLFGTVKNAHRQLGLDGVIPYAAVYRVLHHEPILPGQRDLLEEAWERWRLIYLRPEVPLDSRFQLDPTMLDTLPPWHPEPRA